MLWCGKPTPCAAVSSPPLPPPPLSGNYAAGDAGDAAADASATVMVATDLAARGLDFPGTIDHVINFDMPNNAIDYLHRSGGVLVGGCMGVFDKGGRGEVVIELAACVVRKCRSDDELQREQPSLPVNRCLTGWTT